MRSLALAAAFAGSIAIALATAAAQAPGGSTGSGAAATQTLFRADGRRSFTGPAEFFTGKVQVEPLFPSNDTARFSGAYVTFEPGARSAWHSHPAGQHIVVTAGVGRTGTLGGPVEEIKAGDVVWCPPGVTHWHGASPTSAMTHLVVTGSLEGSNVEWKEKVTDDQYADR